MSFAGGMAGALLKTPDTTATTPTTQTAPAASSASLVLPPLVVPAPTVGETIEVVVKRNDTLESLFRRMKLSLDDLSRLLQIPELRRNLNRIRAGEKLTVIHDNGAVHKLKRRIGDTQMLAVTRNENGFEAKVVDLPIDTEITYAHGIINSSLFSAASAAGVSAETTLRLANDIFGWEIDFALDIREGDRFAMLYEQRYHDGHYIGDGRILAAQFVNAGAVHQAVYYASDDGKVQGYFSPDGRSMRRQFLRSPVDFTRVSSNFNRARHHPILNRIRRHQGVDYAAPTGTPIKASADGRVDFVGYKGGYGKTIVLEHGGGISTLYAHMSRFADGVHSGRRVRQGQIIGYVGASGAATGPHLHYEYRIRGVHMNPRTVPLPAANPIPPEYLADFRIKSNALLAELERAGETTVAAVSTR